MARAQSSPPTPVEAAAQQAAAAPPATPEQAAALARGASVEVGPSSWSDPVLGDDVEANWRGIRLERGWSWVELATQFEREGQDRLARWARANGRAEGQARGAAAPIGRTAAPTQQASS